jgi:hypothetical protein
VWLGAFMLVSAEGCLRIDLGFKAGRTGNILGPVEGGSGDGFAEAGG